MEFIKVFYIFITLVQYSIWCREYEECQGIDESDVVVASKKSCAKYVICDGENSYEGECLAGNYFNEDSASCEDPQTVECNIEPDDDVKSIYDEDFEPNENSSQDTVIAATTTIGNNKDQSVTSTGMKEEEKNYSEENKVVANNTNISEQVNDICLDVNNINYIKNVANPESCVAFYTCYNGRAIPMLCPAKMFFNENSAKCQSQMPETCKIKYSLRLNCQKGIYDLLPHPYRCEYYYYCLNGYLMITRCPNDFTWHFERRTCVQKSQSKCYLEKSVIY